MAMDARKFSNAIMHQVKLVQRCKQGSCPLAESSLPSPY